jgi:hypothetical protein
MKTLLMVPVLVAALVSSACLDAVTTVKVNADGSGTIVARMLYTRDGQQRLQDFAPLLGGGADASKLTEADAGCRGPLRTGATFVSATPIKGTEGDGIGRLTQKGCQSAGTRSHQPSCRWEILRWARRT